MCWLLDKSDMFPYTNIPNQTGCSPFLFLIHYLFLVIELLVSRVCSQSFNLEFTESCLFRMTIRGGSTGGAQNWMSGKGTHKTAFLAQISIFCYTMKENPLIYLSFSNPNKSVSETVISVGFFAPMEIIAWYSNKVASKMVGELFRTSTLLAVLGSTDLATD